MSTVNLTSENYENVVKDNDIVLIDFWADWCGPCKMFGPIFEKVSEKFDDVVFAKCNTQDAQNLAATFGIRSIPTVIAIRDNVMVFNQSGALPEPALEELVTKIKELDMEDVKDQVE
ncbi:MAG: thioredoxin [Gammaproteobacteria bacterium]|nr:MAG: thioredoxin [Gammaproteobacteria bacterium]